VSAGAASSGKSVMKMCKRVSVSLLVLICAGGFAGCDRRSREARYVESGKQYLEKKDYARAAIQFNGAVQSNPNNAENYYQLGLAEIGLGDYVAAQRALSMTIDLNPKHMGAQLKLAEVLTAANTPELLNEVQEHARAVLQASPDDPDALDAMAAAELKLGNREESLKLLERAGNKAPAHLQTAVMRAAAQLAVNDKTGAERILRQAVEKSPDSQQARMIMGMLDLVVQKPKDAEAQFRKVLEKDPKHAIALVELAATLTATGRKNEAEQIYRRLAYGPASQYQPLYGRYLFEEGKQREAVAEFERLAKLDPKDINARTTLVAAYFATRRIGEARAVLKAALDNNPRDVPALSQRSQLNIVAGSYADARADLNQVLHYNTDSDKAHFLLATVERAEGSAEKERQELAEVLRLNPQFFAARVALARSYLTANQGHAALDLMDRTPPDQQKGLGFITYHNWALLSIGDLKGLQTGISGGLAQQRTRDLLLQQALLNQRQQNEAAARPFLLEILKNNPEDPGALNFLIRGYIAEKKLPAAIDEIRALLIKRPQSAALQYHLGVLLVAKGERKEARDAFTAAVTHNSQFVPSRLALAAMDQADGKADAARQELEPLLTSKAGELSARMGLSIIEAKAGNYPKAIEHLRKIVDAQPNNVIALNNLAYLLADHTDQTDDALKYAQKAKELAPNDVNVEGTIGWAYFRKGMYGPALQHLQDAAKREGNNVMEGTAIRRYHLAMAYKKAGDGNNAAKILNVALKLDPNLPEARIASNMVAEASER